MKVKQANPNENKKWKDIFMVGEEGVRKKNLVVACARLNERKSRITNEVKKQRPPSNLIIVAFDNPYQFSFLPPVTISVRKGVKMILKRRKVHMNTYLEMQWVATCGASLLLAELIYNKQLLLVYSLKLHIHNIRISYYSICERDFKMEFYEKIE